MFSKTLLTSAVLASLALQGYAHAAIAPVLGVQGTPQRSDVLRANNNCGGGNVGAIDSSTALPVDGNGVVSGLTIINFNGGGDGSRNIKSVSVNTDGSGQSFTPAQVTQNGDPNPSNTGSEPLTVQLPANTKCGGGATKDKCLLSLTTTAGFGNCVVIQQSGGGNNNAAAAAPAAAAASPAAAAPPAPPAAAAAAAPVAAQAGQNQNAAQAADGGNGGKGGKKGKGGKGKGGKGKGGKGKGKGKGKGGKGKGGAKNNGNQQQNRRRWSVSKEVY